jgi:DNA mismatch repair ATPase MutL
MPITALPQATVRAIGSTSVISDACSVVKELLDNALDASATSIGIEISPNTVGVIQVKDNGHGIPSSDHPFVCTRTFTSKIQTVEDLRRLGGKSLGFRGEALASTAEVSGGVTVTTRVEAELVGSSIKYGRTGELIRYLRFLLN